MMDPVDLLTGLAAFGGAGLGSLWLTRERLPADAPAVERWAVTSSIAYLGLAGLTSLLFLLPCEPMGVSCRLVASRAPLVASLLMLVLGRLLRRTKARPSVPTWHDGIALAVAAMVFALFFVGTDARSFTPWCLHRGLRYILLGQLPDEPTLPGPSPLLQLPIHEHLGNVFLMAVPLALFPGWTERVASGLVAALLLLTATALALRITGRRWPALLLGGSLLLTNDVFSSEVTNVNLIAAWLATLLLLVMTPAYETRGLVRGFVAGFLTQSRYIAVLGLGALVLVTWRDRRKDGVASLALGLACVAAGFVLATLPTVVTHLHAYGTPFDCAALHDVKRYTYTLFGVQFTYPGLLNAPLHSQLVRTPFNPYPMWLGWPLHVLRQVGVLGAGLFLVGLASFVRPRIRAAAAPGVLAAFALPIALFLLVQENWMETEKLTIWLLLAPAFLAVVAAGVSDLAERSLRTSAIRAGLAVTVACGIAYGSRGWLNRVDVPQDARFREVYAAVPSENPELMSYLRRESTRVRLLPLPHEAGILEGFGRKLGQIEASFGAGPGGGDGPSVVQRLVEAVQGTCPQALAGAQWSAPRAADEARASRQRCLSVDLSTSLVVADEPVRPCVERSATTRLVLTPASGCQATLPEERRVPYLDRNVAVAACLEDDTVFVLLAPIAPSDADDPLRRRVADDEDVPGRPLDAFDLEFPATAREVRLLEATYLPTARIYRRILRLADDGSLDLRAPTPWLHN